MIDHLTGSERELITRNVAEVDEIIDDLVAIELRASGDEILDLLALTTEVKLELLDEQSILLVAARAIQRLAQSGGGS